MKHHTKALIGSIITFFVGTSCCWLSSLAVWLGGVAFFGILIKWIENFQIQLIVLSILLAILSIYLYQKKNENNKQ